MVDEMDTNEGDLSDPLSENEYDDANLQLLRERDDDELDHDNDHDNDHDHDHDHDHDDHDPDQDRDYDTDMDKLTGTKTIKAESSFAGAAVEPKKKYDPKDPLRPRRKKARRACYACQRAHLTCGDERPCQRCIKRGLADGCQDGVRKKAKYLHDAPAEALRPVLGPNFNSSTTPTTSRPNGHRHLSSAGSDVSTSNVSAFYTPSNAAPFNVFSSQTPAGSLPESLAFPPASPVSPSFGPPSVDGANQLSRMGLSSAGMADFSPALFDPSNPALFNFNLEGINFGSQYAAMEFGMLGHMSSGAADDPHDPTSLSQAGAVPGSGVGSFGTTDVFGGAANPTLFDAGTTAPGGGLVGDFIGLDPANNGLYSQGNLQHGLPHAYAIAAAPASLQSPSTDNNSPQPTSYGFEGSPTMAQYTGSASGGVVNGSGGHQVLSARPSISHPSQSLPQPHHKPTSAVSKLLPHSSLGKRHRDPSAVYETVKEPYMYVAGFHRLIELLKRRFATNKTMRIAKALSSIRPSFISCTRTLNRQDLVFMEKCFQRTLFEYEDFMMQASSPAIVCRRTGEVAAVNKEFTALTGWTKEVLLGKEPNLNVNLGLSAGALLGGVGSGVSSGGTVGTANASSGVVGVGLGRGNASLATPRLRALNAEAIKASEGKVQPMFIAELMDDDNVIEFYEDFAHLAFGDSRGSVNRKCRLLKYRTREMLDASASSSIVDEPQGKGAGSSAAVSGLAPPPTSSILSSRVARIDGEHGISKIERDGKLECSYCWHIRRDTFDIPMMIVMNFLPCYYPNQEPHQLAV